MSETGIVKAYDPAANLITIEFEGHGTCKSCGLCLIGKGTDHAAMQVTARNTVDAKVGDSVEFEVKEGAMLRASFLLYGFPLAMLLMGFVIGRYIAYMLHISQDLVGLGVAFSFFGLAFLIISRLDKQGDAGAHIELIRVIRAA